MKRYVFIHLYNDFSGSPRVLREAVDAINGEKCVITSNSSGILSNIENVDYSYFRYNPSENRIMKLFFFLVANINIFFLLAKEIIRAKQQGKDIKVIVNTMLPFGSLWAAKLFGIQAIVYLHETSISPKMLKRFLRFSISICAEKIIFVSQYLMERERFRKLTQTVIYNPITPAIISDNVSIDEKFAGKNILFLSSLVPYKGLDDFIKIARISEENLDGLSYYAVLNTSKEKFESFTLKNQLPVNMKIFCRPNNLSDFYAHSAFVLNLSNPDLWIETFGLTLLEGMINSSIPIGPTVGGPAELINSKNGFKIEHYQHAQINKTMTELLNNKECYEYYSGNAYTDAKKYLVAEYSIKLQDFIN